MGKFDYYRINIPHVVHEVIDGEAVLVNMKSGYYYSLDDEGAEIWNLIEQGNSVSQIEKILIQNYNASSTEIKAGLNELIHTLHDEDLIVGLNELQNITNKDKYQYDIPLEKKKFGKPTLHKYTDMEDLLLLDPIHDVDEETGWPDKSVNNNK
jgi:hypothetical protein